ncbi:MAG: acetolactate decarboxylase [Flavobacteriales bacterium]|nr:acetolactate decarboxylase [Flavobacteriales bacterium]MCB9201393.1 acetolactate decarboxylase [Flavobacteriales bacterium]
MRPLPLALLLLCSAACAQNGPVVATGAMRNTMFNGQLAGLVQLDSLCAPGNYGLGPVEYLRGELLLWDGHPYRATATGDTAMRVEERPASRAPFFVHQHVTQWTEVALPDSVTDLPALDAFLTARFGAAGTPFAFTLSGTFQGIDLHLVDVSPGHTITGPDDAHRENKHFHLSDVAADALGFFSTKHKAVFTHHDTNIHVHALTTARDRMGHVEAFRIAPGACRLRVAR